MRWASLLVVLAAGCGAVPNLRSEGTFKGVLQCIQDIEQGSVLVDRNIYAYPQALEIDSSGNVVVDGLPIRLGDRLTGDGNSRVFTVTEIDESSTWIIISYVTSSVGNEPSPFEGLAFDSWFFFADGTVEQEFQVHEIINNESGRPIGSSHLVCTGILERE